MARACAYSTPHQTVQVWPYRQTGVRYCPYSGLNRQIRRMCEVFGYDVRRLQRVRIINIKLDGLKNRAVAQSVAGRTAWAAAETQRLVGVTAK